MDIDTVIDEVRSNRRATQKAAGKRKADLYGLTDEQLHEVLERKRKAAPTPPPPASGEKGPKRTRDADAATPAGRYGTPVAPGRWTPVSVQFDSRHQNGDDPDPWT